MRVLVDTARVATMGFVETFGTLGRLLRHVSAAACASWTSERPALVVLIDYPEFNLLLAKRAKALGIPVFYFIAPAGVGLAARPRPQASPAASTSSASSSRSRPTLYNNGRQLAEFVGHPLLDVVQATRTREETRARYRLDAARPLLALLPGSRKKEIRYLLPAGHRRGAAADGGGLAAGRSRWRRR